MGIAVALLDLAILLTVVIAGSRLLGRERQAVLLDFLLHPLALDECRTTSTGGEEREAQGLVGWLAPVADLLDAATAS